MTTGSPLETALMGEPAVKVRQRRELIELLGIETRNKYEISTESGAIVGYAAEQQKGLLGVVLRQFLGHWRSFDLHIFDSNRHSLFVARHPFRIFFQRLELYSHEGRLIGAVQRRWALFHKHFDIEDERGQPLMQVRSPWFRIWTFKFERRGRLAARLEKKWGGFLKEVFTDTDTFRIEWTDTTLSYPERALIVTAGIYIDLLYFERKAN